MPKQKFNFAAANNSMGSSILSDISSPTINQEEPVNQNTPARMEIKYIPKHKIRENTKNNYPIIGIESLANSILTIGLQQPLTTIYIMEEDKYIIEAGHRRFESLNLLIEKYRDLPSSNDPEYKLYEKNVKQFETGYPCIVKDKLNDEIVYDESLATSVIDSEIRLIITNEEIRNTPTNIKAQNIQRLSELYEMKNRGKSNKEKMNINQQIAADLNLKPRQVANYKAINNLIPELRQEFQKNNITLKEGSNYASLSESEQRDILTLILSGVKVRDTELKIIKEEKNKVEKELSDQMAILMDKLAQKETALQNSQEALKDVQTTTSSQEYQNLLNTNNDMEEEILALKNQIVLLKNKPVVEKDTPNLTESQLEIMKTELKVKTAYEAAKEAVCRYLSIERDFIDITQNDTIKSDYDIQQNKKQLMKLLGEN